MSEPIAVFRPYPFKVGQKIHIRDSHRAGDWLVIDLTKTKVTLQCPISKKELVWDRFCYFVEENEQVWPLVDE